MTRLARFLVVVLAADSLACDGPRDTPPDTPPATPLAPIDSVAQAANPIFRVSLWPGEGIPVIEAVRHDLALRRSPAVDAPIAATLRADSGRVIEYDSTSFQTLAPGSVRAVRKAFIRGRHLGAITELSTDAYYSSAFPDTAIAVDSAATVELLQYRAEGSCFLRFGGSVIDANPCPTLDSDAFQFVGEPSTRWWIHVRTARATGWLLLADSTAKVVRRTF